jgi:hypothetical protein
MSLTLDQIAAVRQFQLDAVAALESEAASYWEAANKATGDMEKKLRAGAHTLGGAAVIISALPTSREAA